MRQKMKSLTAMLLVGLMLGAMVMPQQAEASVEPWMETAEEITLGKTVSDRLENEEDYSSSPEKYYYLSMSSDMEVTLKIWVSGTETISWVYFYDKDGSTNYSYNNNRWEYDRKSNTSTMTMDVSLEKGDNYLMVEDWLEADQCHSYSFMITKKAKETLTEKGSGTSSGSQAKKVTVKKPKSFTAKKKGKKKAILRWKKASGVKGYQIYRKAGKNGKYKKIATVSSSKTSYTNKKLKRKKTYYYKIRSYKKSGGKTYYSGWSSVKKVRLK